MPELQQRDWPAREADAWMLGPEDRLQYLYPLNADQLELNRRITYEAASIYGGTNLFSGMGTIADMYGKLRCKNCECPCTHRNAFYAGALVKIDVTYPFFEGSQKAFLHYRPEFDVEVEHYLSAESDEEKLIELVMGWVEKICDAVDKTSWNESNPYYLVAKTLFNNDSDGGMQRIDAFMHGVQTLTIIESDFNSRGYKSAILPRTM